MTVAISENVRAQLEAQGFSFTGSGRCKSCGASCMIVLRDGVKLYAHPEPACEEGYEVENETE